MIHHDSRPYDIAATEAGRKMREKLQADIAAASTKAKTAITKIYDELPEDRSVDARALRFSFDERLRVTYGDGSNAEQETVHPWALGQMTQAVGLRRDFILDLLTGTGTWAHDLAVHNLHEFFAHQPTRHLCRSVKGELRGFLSPRYQRRHPGQLLEAFLASCRRHGLLAYEAWCSDTRHGARAMLDRIIEPVPNEPMAIGVYYGESPYGNGATELSISIQRMWCTNQAIIEQNLRQAHLGGLLPEDVTWSEETYQADTRLIATKLNDLLTSSVSNSALDRLVARVRAAHTKNLSPEQFQTFLAKNLNKTEAAAVTEIHRTGGVERLPPGDTVWRASNAISFFAQGPELSDERRIELQKLAGSLLPAAK